MRSSLHGPLVDVITSFVTARRGLGYKCVEEARLLRRLDRFLAVRGLASLELPRDLVREWLAKTPHERPQTQASRIGVTRRLARFMVDRGLPAYVPPPARMGITHLDFTPRIFTRAEIAALLAHLDRLPATPRSPRRHIVMPELFRILYGCGLRISEALKLTVADVDLDQGVLLVREGKFRKDRLVPVAPGVAERLRRYAGALERAWDLGQAFFPKRDGSHYAKRAVYSVFRRVLWEAGMSHGGRGRGPRLHDLRHTFAVHRLEEWYRQGADLGAKLPVLSAYMGHRSLVGTQRYLRLTPALFPEVAASVEAIAGHVMPRRDLT
ncbi:tyrosine-type recombinase/integrase [Planctomycetota bacterium]